nr:AI-2E family transporter [Clostridium sp.]
MQSRFDRKYLKYVIYITLAATLIFISYNVVFNFGELLRSIINAIKDLISMISPLITGIIIAYLLYPLSKLINVFL